MSQKSVDTISAFVNPAATTTQKALDVAVNADKRFQHYTILSIIGIFILLVIFSVIIFSNLGHNAKIGLSLLIIVLIFATVLLSLNLIRISEHEYIKFRLEQMQMETVFTNQQKQQLRNNIERAVNLE